MKILVYPFGTEIAFEVYHALCHVKNIELWGGASDFNNHGSFVFENIVAELPFISDCSTEDDVRAFEDKIAPHHFDMIYPAMDGVIYKFAQFRSLFKENVIVPDFETARITRSKAQTYTLLKDSVLIPRQYARACDVESYPVFVKPDVGQGSVGARKVDSKEELARCISQNGDLLILEYLPGEEFTVDCFTNSRGELVSVSPRKRLRMKNGISVACEAICDSKIDTIAAKINAKIHNRGGWFFQLKKRASGEYILLEVSSRIGGTSAFTRALGINLPLLTVETFSGKYIDSVPLVGHKNLRIDRALSNSYKTDLRFDSVYTDFDDTLIVNGHLNVQLVAFLYDCIDKNKKVYLLTRHDDKKLGKLSDCMKRYHLSGLFDEVIHIGQNEQKTSYIKNQDSIYIDDSYGERLSVKNALGIPVLDPSMVEPLICTIHGGGGISL